MRMINCAMCVFFILMVQSSCLGQLCYKLTTSHCSNYATPSPFLCGSGPCMSYIIPGTPPKIGWRCPREREEEFPADPWVKTTELVPQDEYGLDSQEEIEEKPCIIYHYCNCEPPAGGGNPVCHACSCNHEDHLIFQKQPTGNVCLGQ